MSSVEEVTRLLALWEEQSNTNKDVTATLNKLADIFELETAAFLKKDPDPFDDRHPSRLQPDCTFGHMLKCVFRNERIVDHIVKVYCQRDVVELNTAACRLLLDILPGLESVVFQEEGFVPRLLHWAEKAPNPLQAYATSLLASAMEVPEIATNFREKNAYFVPLMLRRLRKLSMKYLQNPPPSEETHVPERPFAFLGGMCGERSNNSVDENFKNSSRKSSKKRKDGARSLRYCPIPILHSESKMGMRKSNIKNSPVKFGQNCNDGSNSNWSELEHYVIGSYQVYPLTLAVEQQYILQYLTPMGEYQDLLGHIFEENALPLILGYIDLRQNPDVRLAFEALKYLASLLCHKKIAIEFLNVGGLQLLLKVPFPSIAATGVSLCFYYLSYIEEAMEKICLLPPSIISELVHYALWLLECSHDSSRCHATMFFGYAFVFRTILEHFDMQDGLRKLFNVMSTLDIFGGASARNMSDDQVFANRQTTGHVCGALKRYFEAHLVAEIDRQVSSTRKQDHSKPQSKDYKPVNLSSENIESYMETWREMLSPNHHWKPVEEFLNLEGVMFLLDLITSYFELSYSGKPETVKNALGVLKICSLTSMTQLMFCERVSSEDYFNITGILVLLQAADGELMPGQPDIQRCALQTIINCVCTKIPSQEKTGNSDSRGDWYSKGSSTPKKKAQRSIEDNLNKLWKSVRIKNGIIILINLLSIKTPLTDADSIRALACQALCGLARSETVKQIISKLPLITEGQLFDLMKEPVLQDKGHDHVQFCKFGIELLERVTGAPVSDGSESSMLNINKSEIVAKTKVVYNDAQLLQLISDHLSAKGLTETVSCLQKEMLDKSLVPPVAATYNFSTPMKPTSNVSSSALQNYRNSDVYSSPSLNTSTSVNTIPPPSVPLKIIVNKKIQVSDQKLATPSRLQKPQTCSGNYVQTPAMKRQATNVYLFGDPQSSISLDSIVTEYLRKQHALCKNPVLACPPFDLFVPHKCPEPKHKRNAPVNCVLRIHKKQLSDQNGGFGGAALDRKFIYSKFRLVKSFRDEEGRIDFVCNSFQNFNIDSKHRPRMLIGTVGNLGNSMGKLKVFNINTGDEELSRDGHQRGVSHIESSKFNSLLITSDNGRIGNSALWNADGNFEVVHNFNAIQHLEFGKRTATRAVGTTHDSAVIIDTTTCVQLQEFPSGDLGNNYTGRSVFDYCSNRATFDYSDEFILSDGLIFDVRSNEMVHKLDKFNATFNGVFHPNGREIISNTEIWDLRTFKLLRTVVSLDQCRVVFNQPGSIIYGVYSNNDQPEKKNCFYTFNAYDYSPIATVDVKRPVFQLSVDLHDKYISTIESQFAVPADQFPAPVAGVDCVCRLYEIGRTKKEGDEDGEESDSEEESEDDDEMDDDENDEGQNDEDVLFEIGDDSSDSSDEDDETLFSLNTSMED